MDSIQWKQFVNEVLDIRIEERCSRCSYAFSWSLREADQGSEIWCEKCSAKIIFDVSSESGRSMSRAVESALRDVLLVSDQEPI